MWLPVHPPCFACARHHIVEPWQLHLNIVFVASHLQDRQLGCPSRLLVVKPPFAQQIVRGVKTWELRSSNTDIRERIGIALSGSKTILGEASLVDVLKLDANALAANFDQHQVPQQHLNQFVSNPVFALVLERACEYQMPKPYEHPLGAIKWVQVSPDTFQSDGVSRRTWSVTFPSPREQTMFQRLITRALTSVASCLLSLRDQLALG